MDEGYFLHVDDLDLCLRLHRSGIPIYFAPHVKAIHHEGSSRASAFQIEWHKARSFLRYFRVHYRGLRWLPVRGPLAAAILTRFGVRAIRSSSLLDGTSRFFARRMRRKTASAGTGSSGDRARKKTEREPQSRRARTAGGRPASGDPELRRRTGREAVRGHSRREEPGRSIPCEAPRGRGIHGLVCHAPSGAVPVRSTAGVWLANHARRRTHERSRHGDSVLPRPLSALPAIISRISGGGTLIALSSSGAALKAKSSDPEERRTADAQRRAEDKIRRICRDRKLVWTLFRPALIYDPGRDRNVSVIADFIQRFGVFPVVWPGLGYRQPVHADDVANAMANALNAPRARETLFELPGGETVTYRDMVRAIFVSLGRRPVLVYLPLGFARAAFRVWQAASGTSNSAASLDRMNASHILDPAPVREILGMTCRPFRPEFPGAPARRSDGVRGPGFESGTAFPAAIGAPFPRSENRVLAAKVRIRECTICRPGRGPAYRPASVRDNGVPCLRRFALNARPENPEYMLEL